jgi:putative phosphoesterase
VSRASGPTRAVVVGVIADTHGLLRPGVAGVFAGVSRILHAGDVGGAAVLADLARIAPVDAVRGNVDDPHDPMLAGERTLTIAGVTVHLSHGHEVGRPTPALLLSRYAADVVIFGHTHRAVVERDGSGRVALNPGAAGPRRFDLEPSVALLTLGGSAAAVGVEIISLA